MGTFTGSTFGAASQWIYEQLSQGPLSGPVLALVPTSAMAPGVNLDLAANPRITWHTSAPSFPVTAAGGRKTCEKHRFSVEAWDQNWSTERVDAVADAAIKALDRQDCALLTGGWWIVCWEVPGQGQISIPQIKDGEAIQHLITDFYLLVSPYP